jgi:purine-binding chemotaxis protein CheW
MARAHRKRTGPVDWSHVHRRLAQAGRSAQYDATADQAILRERARRLAQPFEAATPRGEELELVSFVLSGERYALEAECVLQVIKLQQLTRLPGAPDHLLGLTNLRGEILPVFDLRALLGLSRVALNDLSRLLVLGDVEAELGVLADEVLELARVRRTELRPPAQGLALANLPYLHGVTSDGLIALDGGALLHDPRLFLGVAEHAREGERQST